jgi:hypothetical protein
MDTTLYGPDDTPSVADIATASSGGTNWLSGISQLLTTGLTTYGQIAGTQNKPATTTTPTTAASLKAWLPMILVGVAGVILLVLFLRR